MRPARLHIKRIMNCCLPHAWPRSVPTHAWTSSRRCCLPNTRRWKPSARPTRRMWRRSSIPAAFSAPKRGISSPVPRCCWSGTAAWCRIRWSSCWPCPAWGGRPQTWCSGDIYGKPAVVADTHCIRISNRLGMAHAKEPVKVERELRALLPPEKSSDFCHRLVLHGRAVCMARSPRCADCVLAEICEKNGL